MKKFTTPSAKIKMAYDTIVKLEAEVNKLREINLELINVLNPFIDSCYKGCTKDELDQLRINAEKVLNSL